MRYNDWPPVGVDLRDDRPPSRIDTEIDIRRRFRAPQVI